MFEVLVVDDDALSRGMISEILRHSGFDVVEAEDGEKAIEIILQRNIRVVISDWEMPRVTGIDLCRTLRAMRRSCYVYVILLTVHHGAESFVRGMAAGADDFASKPCHPQELVCRVQAAQRVLSQDFHQLTIFGMAKLAESRDTETGRHLERVQFYARLLAEKLLERPRYHRVIDSAFVQLVYQTSPLHDIGKVAIPDAILLKPGKLTEQEYEIMKTHTTIGAEILDAALRIAPGARFLQMARNIAAYHHERFDGLGYPFGLYAEDIPMEARIVCVADSYDAITSRRIYKPAFPHEHARKIILDESGKQFDPNVVDAFLAVEAEFDRVRKSFSQEVEVTYSPLVKNAKQLSMLKLAQ